MDFELFEKVTKNADSEDGVSARFYDRAVKTSEFDANGFPIFENVCFCEIRLKDNNTEVFDQPATSDKIARFPVEYARYQQGRRQIESGTPLEQFAFLTLAEVEALKYRGIFTIEALASLPDEKAEALNVGKEKDLAQRFINGAKNQMTVEKYQQQLEAAEAEIKALKEQLKKSSGKTKGKTKP